MNVSTVSNASSKAKNLKMAVFNSREDHLEGLRLIHEERGLEDFICIDFLSFLVVSIEIVSFLKERRLRFQSWQEVDESAFNKKQADLLEKKKAFLVKANGCGTFFVEHDVPAFVSNGGR